MTKAQRATADVFLTALKALPKNERDAVVVRIARDKAFARDTRGLALIAYRRREPSRPFREHLSQKNGRWHAARLHGPNQSLGREGDQSSTARSSVGGAITTSARALCREISWCSISRIRSTTGSPSRIK